MNFKFSFDQKSFLREKLLLLGALACEVVALLIRREIIAADPELVGRLTVAGVVLMLIWLVIDGLKKTARRVRANMGLDDDGEAEDAAEEAEPEEIAEDAQRTPEEDEGGTN